MQFWPEAVSWKLEPINTQDLIFFICDPGLVKFSYFHFRGFLLVDQCYWCHVHNECSVQYIGKAYKNRIQVYTEFTNLLYTVLTFPRYCSQGTSKLSTVYTWLAAVQGRINIGGLIDRWTKVQHGSCHQVKVRETSECPKKESRSDM